MLSVVYLALYRIACALPLCVCLPRSPGRRRGGCKVQKSRVAFRRSFGIRCFCWSLRADACVRICVGIRAFWRCEKLKNLLARRGSASRPARPARCARLSFGILQVKVLHFFRTSPRGLRVRFIAMILKSRNQDATRRDAPVYDESRERVEPHTSRQVGTQST